MKLYRATVSIYSMRRGDLVLAKRLSESTSRGAHAWIILIGTGIKMVYLFDEDLELA